ncbi:MAG: 16S rRNA (guanine(527)-N(7))-methyltransferase RsmG [Acidobacteria bacterium]|nr:MAG: 16S rRNA (guanine(527)-N(7))-methyltransferase RsmG [Acidobacteriota bacterium]
MLPQGSGSSILLVRTILERGCPGGQPFLFRELSLSSTLRLHDFTGKSLVRDDFINAVKSNQEAFRLDLGDDVVERLADYYELVQQHNPILHLVGPCSPEEFATRHILESLTLLEFLPANARLADIGTGAGLPAIPCLIARGDISAVLIESKQKKCEFLKTAASNLSLGPRIQIIDRQFEEVNPSGFEVITCRALDKLVDKLPRLLKWGKSRTFLLFGGFTLLEALDNLEINYRRKLMPLSRQRFLFVFRKQIDQGKFHEAKR